MVSNGVKISNGEFPLLKIYLLYASKNKKKLGLKPVSTILQLSFSWDKLLETPYNLV